MVKSWIHDTKLNFTVNFFPNFFFSWKTTECQCCSESNLPQPLEPTVHQILFLGRHIRNITGENKQGYLCSSIILSPLRNITPPNTMAEENKRIEPYEMVGNGCSLIKQRLKVRKHQEDQFR